MGLDRQAATERFYELVWPLRGDVLRVALALCHSESEADDLAQETLMKAFAGIESFREGVDAKPWLFRILRNARIDRIRSAARESGTVSLESAEIETEARAEIEDFGDDPQQVLNAFSDQQMIDALRELPEEIRMTLLLVEVQQLDHRDAAEILDVPVGTIKSRAHRGRAMLREKLLPLAKELRLVR